MNNTTDFNKHCIEAAYCFLHQKWRVYEFSNMEWQKDDIEYAIAQYVDGMSTYLYQQLAMGKPDFLTDHTTFGTDMQNALERMEEMLNT